MTDRRSVLRNACLGMLAQAPLAGKTVARLDNAVPRGTEPHREVAVALIQCDSVPEQIERNLAQMEQLTEQAVQAGARWVIFHEGTVCDYTPRLAELAEPVPDGTSTRRMVNCARRLGCYVSWGLSERHQERYYITQVFAGPKGFLYRYRKTWIWREPDDKGYRNEWARYDPGSGPELFQIDGVQATCFICADGEAPRCIQRAAQLHPEVVFYPNNRANLPAFEVFGERAKAIGAPMLVTNRIGSSWVHHAMGGCVVYSRHGEVLAQANRKGQVEIMHHNLEFLTA